MKSIKPFINLGWHTIPLKGELKRLSNGKKTTPRFPDNWKDKYTKDKNKEETPLGGVLTGEVSGIIAIDCDNTATYEIFKALDPDYKFHFVSIGKKDGLQVDQKAGTIIYKYDKAVEETFKIHNSHISLDFLSTGGMAFLPTDANATKENIDLNNLELREAPNAILALLQSIRPIKIERVDEALTNKKWTNHLAPQLNKFIKTKKLIPELFRILTPKSYRHLPEYIEKGYLYPDDISDGGGSDYLSKISAILGADESVDVDLYMDTMKLINDFFSLPMKRVRLDNTIIEPMVEERSSIDGKSIWTYNESWADNKLTLMTKRNSIIEMFFDPKRVRYYIVDIGREEVQNFSRDNEFVSYIEAVATEAPTKKEIKVRLPLVDAISTPKYPFGFFAGKDDIQAFNTFRPTLALSIFKNPEFYKTQYTRPEITLKYFETFIPDIYMRNYLLKFMRRKLDKFEYSPVMLYFLGAPGAGKDTLVNILERIIGKSCLTRPSTDEFLELYNGWMLDKYFVQLDEYGDQLTSFKDKEKAKGLIKSYTGKKTVSIREMRTNSYDYDHNITFIMTANKNPLYIEEDDRRIALFDCPNTLKWADWVQSYGGMSEVIEQIERETNDFAYYLSTELSNCTKDEFTDPPETQDKQILIASKFNASQKIAYLLKTGLFVELEKLAEEHDILKLFDGAPEGRLYEEELFDLYYEMTDQKGTKRGLTIAMKEFDKIPSTRNQIKSYYYNVPKLRGYRRTVMTAITEEDVVPKNINVELD